jgi:hypothetical protein
MARKNVPTDRQFETAILWLENNEGDAEEAEACRAVASWIERWRADKMLKDTARQAGVSVAALRRKLAGRDPVPDEEEN